MSMIQGIGDEVLQFFTVVIVVVIALLAWCSTNITEGPLIRTVLILERRSRGTTTNDSANHQQQSIASGENNIDTGQSNPTGIQELVEAEAVSSCRNSDNKDESESSSSLLLPSNQPVAAVQLDGGNGDSQSREQVQSQPNVPQVQGENNESTAASGDSDSSVLRQRRLAFFQSRGPTLLESSTSSEVPGEMPATTIEDNEDEDEEELSAGSQDHIRIRLKYLNDDQIVVEGRLQEQLGDFKRRHFSIELAAEKMVRLIFNGQVLQSDSQTLQGYGLFDNCVVHCLVHNQRSNVPRTAHSQTNNSSNQSTPQDWNLGTLLYTCLTIILGFAWYCRYQYSHLFTVTTTAALFGLTGMFVVSFLSIYLPDHDNVQ